MGIWNPFGSLSRPIKTALLRGISRPSKILIPFAKGNNWKLKISLFSIQKRCWKKLHYMYIYVVRSIFDIYERLFSVPYSNIQASYQFSQAIYVRDGKWNLLPSTWRMFNNFKKSLIRIFFPQNTINLDRKMHWLYWCTVVKVKRYSDYKSFSNQFLKRRRLKSKVQSIAQLFLNLLWSSSKCYLVLITYTSVIFMISYRLDDEWLLQYVLDAIVQ